MIIRHVATIGLIQDNAKNPAVRPFRDDLRLPQFADTCRLRLHDEYDAINELGHQKIVGYREKRCGVEQNQVELAAGDLQKLFEAR